MIVSKAASDLVATAAQWILCCSSSHPRQLPLSSVSSAVVWSAAEKVCALELDQASILPAASTLMIFTSGLDFADSPQVGVDIAPSNSLQRMRQLRVQLTQKRPN